jgi:hypothetical protein
MFKIRKGECFEPFKIVLEMFRNFQAGVKTTFTPVKSGMMIAAVTFGNKDRNS